MFRQSLNIFAALMCLILGVIGFDACRNARDRTYVVAAVDAESLQRGADAKTFVYECGGDYSFVARIARFFLISLYKICTL